MFVGLYVPIIDRILILVLYRVQQERIKGTTQRDQVPLGTADKQQPTRHSDDDSTQRRRR